MNTNMRGSVTVFLMMILVVCLLIIGVITEAAIGKAGRTYGYSIIDLAGRSILSEFDRSLYNEYGIFGTWTDEETVKKKLQLYIEDGREERSTTTNLIRFRIEEIDVDLSGFPLTNLEAFDQQIMTQMKFQTVMDGISIVKHLEEGNLIEEEKEIAGIQSDHTVRGDRTLKNQRVMEALPSMKLIKEGGSILELPMIPNLKEIPKLALENVALNLYIIDHFRHHEDTNEWVNTFFANEIEYVLSGNYNDEINHSKVKAVLLSLRTALNLAHIYSDQSKVEALILAAELLTPGPASLATQIALASTWAGAEAIVDINRLENGKEVPLYKKSSDWSLSLEQVLAENIREDLPNIEESNGLSYEEYLFLFLCFQNRETKLVRIMDLIQLNLQGTQNENFLMDHCYFGFEYRCVLVRENTYLGYSVHRRGEFAGAHVY